MRSVRHVSWLQGRRRAGKWREHCLSSVEKAVNGGGCSFFTTVSWVFSWFVKIEVKQIYSSHSLNKKTQNVYFGLKVDSPRWLYLLHNMTFCQEPRKRQMTIRPGLLMPTKNSRRKHHLLIKPRRNHIWPKLLLRWKRTVRWIKQLMVPNQSGSNVIGACKQFIQSLSCHSKTKPASKPAFCTSLLDFFAAGYFLY